MILRSYLHTDPVAVSYLFGCRGRAAGAVVDPVAPPEHYLAESRALGLPIRYVIDTHLHADHLSTGPELAATLNVPYVVHESAGYALDARRVADGERLELGNVVAEVLHVPGHTPEHLALLVTDRTRAPEPWLVFTGHTLMVGDMGRTELAGDAADGAAALYESAQRLRALPDHLVVLPGAFAGSVCGRALSGNPSSTIGFERRFNRAFALEDRAAFLAFMQRDVPAPPPTAAAVRAANVAGGTLASDLALR